jgi:MFS family permease
MLTRRPPIAMFLLALWIVEITGAFETAMVYAAVGQLIKAFGDPVRVGWLVTVFLLVGAAAAAIVARLGDIYGRRRVMLILLCVTIFASLLSALSSSFALILVGRALQGIAAAILPLCFGLARENLRAERVPVAVGVIMSGATAGTAAGLVIGGYIADRFGWHAVFFASAAMAAVSLLLVRLFVPRSPRGTATGVPLDIGSALLFVPGLLALLLAISSGRDWGWLSGPVLALAAGGVLMLSLWLRRSLNHPSPLIDVRLFANRSVAVANASYALLAIGGLQLTMVFSIMLQAPVWTGVGLGVSAALAGLVKLPSNGFAFLAGPFSGYAMTVLGGRTVMAAGGFLSALGWLVALQFHASPWQVGVSLCMISMGTAILYAAGPAVIMRAVPAERTSEATGMLAVIRSIAMGIGAQLVAILLATSTVSREGVKGTYPDARAFTLTMVVIMVLTFAAAVAALLLPREGQAGGK